MWATARDRVGRALVELLEVGALSAGACAAFAAELRAIGHDIQLLDHRKGDAEKQHALIADASRTEGGEDVSGSRQRAESFVRALEEEHCRHVERLRGWRQRVLAAIDAREGS